ncbi:MAG: Uma2 family endonuclease [Gemmataceae bacterium]
MQRSILFMGEENIRIPWRATSFEGFRRWLHSGSFPEGWMISFIDDQLEVETCMEEFFEHGQVKNEIARVLSNLMLELKFGRFAPDGTRFSSPRARLSTEPDGMVISHDAMKRGRVRLVSGKTGRNTEVVGTPEIVIEIVSPSSEEKDTARLMKAYFKARIPEYWVVDVRDGAIRFDIHHRKPGGYAAERKSGGWAKSRILDRSFRLTASDDESGQPVYTLSVR